MTIAEERWAEIDARATGGAGLRAYGWAVAAVMALAPITTYAGYEGLAPLAAIAGGLALPLLRPRLPPIGLLLVWALVAWAVVSFAWSPLEPRLYSIHRYVDVQNLTAAKLVAEAVLYAAFVLVAVRIPPAARNRALLGLLGAVAVVSLLLVIESRDGEALFQWLSRVFAKPWREDLARRQVAVASYNLALFFWPVALVAWRRGWAALAVLVFVATAAGALLLDVDAPVAALAVSLGAFLVVRYGGRFGVLACLAATVAYFLAAPLVGLSHAGGAVIPADVGKLSWHIRLDIWRFAASRIAAHPLVGWGLDTSRIWPDRIPMHPHDAALQLWLETGVVGVVLAIAFWAWLFFRVDRSVRRDPAAGAVSAATAAVYLVIGAISFGVWQEWWIASGAMALVACRLAQGVGREEEGAPTDEGLAPLD